MFNVVCFVIYIANIIIATGNNSKTVHPSPDSPIVAIRPTRALCAVEMISPSMGSADARPISVAIALIFATMICICLVMNLSDAPTWFNISSSRLCSMAVFRAI